MNRVLTPQQLDAYCNYLRQEEKSEATIEKYRRDVQAFLIFSEKREVTKELVIQYKKRLEEQDYKVRSINSMLAALNGLMNFLGWQECRVKQLKLQRQVYSTADKELTKAEYLRLLEVSKGKQQLNLVLQTICGTGIRVSELQYFTVESVRQGEVSVYCKNKSRKILVPDKLRKALLKYAKIKGIKTGMIFVTVKGKALDRKTIWAQMKRLCEEAGVKPTKVFPHNLRKLFARTFYGLERDIAKLADILGHGNIETTRIYIMTTGTEHRKKIEKLGLVL